MTTGMAFPAWMTEVISRPVGLGRVFYVHGLTGSNANNGVDPNTPFLTIAYALTQCADGRNDYIIVLDGWSEDTPIEIVADKSRVHIIGMACDGMPLVSLTSNADSPIFEVGADFVEIAGFDLGGGDAHGGIEPLAGETADMVYIHHCNFGSEYCGDTPLHGVFLPTGLTQGAKGWKISKCKFMGDDTVQGTLTSSGVKIDEGAQHEVSDNLFHACPVPAISILGFGITVKNNDILMGTDAAGGAITVLIGGSMNFISNNRAAREELAAGSQNPYLDNAADAVTDAWVANYHAETLTGPG